MIPPLIDSLFKGSTLTRQQASTLFGMVIEGNVKPAVLGGVLIAMKIRGETVEEIAGAADAMRSAARLFPRPEYTTIDLVGTGGDGHNTINISTTASVVTSAAGAKVAKHGNRSVSSKSGSSDLLTEFGVNLTMSPSTARRCLDELGLCFLFAPHYHRGFKHALPVRQALKTRTLFNLLGPLINPARPSRMLLGVSMPQLVRPITEVLKTLGVERAMVVHGNGLDEIAIHGPTLVAELTGRRIESYSLSPQDFGLQSAPIEAIVGGSPAQNSEICRAVLSGQGTAAQRHVVAANAGAALYLAGVSATLKTATQLALETMATGKPLRQMLCFAKLSNKPEAGEVIDNG